MSYAALVRAMSAAGAPPEAIALALEALENRDAANEARKAQARDKKRRQRAAARGETEGETVPGQSQDGLETVPAVHPAPNKSPPDPQKLTPTPPSCDAQARAAAAQLSLAVLIAGCGAALDQQQPAKPRWPRDMPPPSGVSAEQWAGFIEHRRAKRETLTPRAYQLLCGKLAKFADDEWPPGRIVDQIVERRWTSFEPDWLPRKTETRNGHRPHNDRHRSRGLLGAVLDAEHADRAGPGL